MVPPGTQHHMKYLDTQGDDLHVLKSRNGERGSGKGEAYELMENSGIGSG